MDNPTATVLNKGKPEIPASHDSGSVALIFENVNRLLPDNETFASFMCKYRTHSFGKENVTAALRNFK